MIAVWATLLLSAASGQTSANCPDGSCGPSELRATQGGPPTTYLAKPIEDFKIVDPEEPGETLEPTARRAQGTQELENISEHYRPAIDDYHRSASVNRPTLETARDNMESVVRISFAKYQELTAGGSDKKRARRIAQLKFVSLDKWSTREVKPDSGIFSARAVFADARSRGDVEAEVIGDFSVPHWHLSEIKLKAPAKKAAQDPARPQETK